ncbi:MAG: GDSL-type esterase/lipase family protein [Prosthecobacter sp.]
MSKHLLLFLCGLGTCLHAQTAGVRLAPASPAFITWSDGRVVLASPVGSGADLSNAPDTTTVYTLDGTEPVAKSNPYLAPIELPHGGIVKARTFSKDRKTMSAVGETTVPPVKGSEAPVPSTVVACTQDRSWPQYDWKTRHELTSAAVKKQQPDILFIGDSITHFFGGEQFDSYALRGKNTWDEFYAPRKAGNLGFGWDKTENVLWRLRHGAVDAISPKVVVMMIGTNNTGTCSALDIVQGITAIVQEFQKRLPQAKILLLGVFPRGEKPGPQRDKIAEINQGISKLNAPPGVTYLDIGPKFLTADGLITKDIMPDFLHPNEKGYRIWAEAMEPTLKKLLGD